MRDELKEFSSETIATAERVALQDDGKNDYQQNGSTG
jgi:hypothetical protein